MKILLAEDDQLLGSGLRTGLRQAGFQVEWVCDGESARREIEDCDYDAVVLDLGLPLKDGLEVLRQARKQGKTLPVLVLTARDAVAQRIEGLDSGADDYVIKPVDLRELSARLRALVRRAHGQAMPTLKAAGVELCPAARTVMVRGKGVDLSAREFDLLHALMLNANRVLTRAQLEAQLYSWGQEIESNAIEVHIHHLRRKLGSGLIQTVRGVGYTFNRPLQSTEK
jgi:two-component system OmpR family response regulator/two-component system response regulator QseB